VVLFFILQRQTGRFGRYREPFICIMAGDSEKSRNDLLVRFVVYRDESEDSIFMWTIKYLSVKLH
jgi:hypothetical protein